MNHSNLPFQDRRDSRDNQEDQASQADQARSRSRPDQPAHQDHQVSTRLSAGFVAFILGGFDLPFQDHRDSPVSQDNPEAQAALSPARQDLQETADHRDRTDSPVSREDPDRTERPEARVAATTAHRRVPLLAIKPERGTGPTRKSRCHCPNTLAYICTYSTEE